VKTLIPSVALTAAAVALAPVARADMQIGNYELQTARDPAHSWVWAVRSCDSGGCVHVAAARLAGSVDSTFAAGCGGAPAGSYTYTFALIRM
jgi:hypothetical protein